MAAFVLIHGGGHGGWCYKKLSPLLRAAGHVVYAPSLTGHDLMITEPEKVAAMLLGIV